MKKSVLLLLIALTGFSACQTEKKKETMLRIETTMGDITVKLYNETPKHRDNFIKLAKEGVYEGTLFHRVINEFMIQAGDPDSKNATEGQMLGAGDVGYTLPAEFVYPKYFHKKGVLSAARQGDQVNPKKESSGCQFYIVTGRVFDEASLDALQEQVNANKLQTAFHSLVGENREKIQKMQESNDTEGLLKLQEELKEKAEKKAKKEPDFLFTPEQKEAYTTIGGTPHLDGQYTVFGEVTEGISVVDEIQKVATDGSDRPTEDIKILKVTVLE